jgi:hypothetical protein
MEFIISPADLQKDLSDRVEANLAARLSLTYTRAEINDVSNCSSALFPESFKISDKLTKQFRNLCSLSNVSLKAGKIIRSHRKVIGPLIVFFKKLTWPFIQVHLKEPIEKIQLFQSQTVRMLAENVSTRDS